LRYSCPARHAGTGKSYRTPILRACTTRSVRQASSGSFLSTQSCSDNFEAPPRRESRGVSSTRKSARTSGRYASGLVSSHRPYVARGRRLAIPAGRDARGLLIHAAVVQDHPVTIPASSPADVVKRTDVRMVQRCNRAYAPLLSRRLLAAWFSNCRRLTRVQRLEACAEYSRLWRPILEFSYDGPARRSYGHAPQRRGPECDRSLARHESTDSTQMYLYADVQLTCWPFWRVSD